MTGIGFRVMVGRPKETSDIEILAIFVEQDRKSLTTAEVREVLGYSQAGTWKRLKALAEKGSLEEHNPGGGTPTRWSISEEGRKLV